MSHHRLCFNVAKEQVGCGATPFLLRFFSLDVELKICAPQCALS